MSNRTYIGGTPLNGTVSGWIVSGVFTRVSDSSFTVADTAANLAAFVDGRPIRYRATAGTYRYGMVVGYVAGTVTLVGAPLTAADDDELQLGDANKVIVENIVIPGRWADAASSVLLADDLLFQWLWGYQTAYLVQMAAIGGTDDSGANQPRVNLDFPGGAPCTANTNAGIEVLDSAWSTSGVNIAITIYDILYGDAIEVTTDANGSNNDSVDLSLRLTFVVA